MGSFEEEGEGREEGEEEGERKGEGEGGLVSCLDGSGGLGIVWPKQRQPERRVVFSHWRIWWTEGSMGRLGHQSRWEDEAPSSPLRAGRDSGQGGGEEVREFLGLGLVWFGLVYLRLLFKIQMITIQTNTAHLLPLARLCSPERERVRERKRDARRV